jgi:hypothetical protein
MRRRLFNLAAAVSLVLCVATVVLWVRGAWRIDELTHWSCDADRRGYSLAMFGCGGGSFGATRFRFANTDAGEVPISLSGRWTFASRVSPPPDPANDYKPRNARERLGFMWGSQSTPSPTSTSPARTHSYIGLRFPMWSLFFASALLPAWWTTSAIRTRLRSKAGLCPACGYDLRATPDRCPECGTSAKPQPAEGAAA